MMNTKNLPEATNKIAVLGIAVTGAAAFAAQHCLQPVISAIAASCSLEPAAASLAVSAGMLGMSVMALALTFCAHRLVRKPCIVSSLLAAGMLSIGIGLSAYFPIIVALRFLQGMVLGLVPVLMLAYIQEEFPPHRRSSLISIYVSGTTLGGILGRFASSCLADYCGWQGGCVLLGMAFLILGAVSARCLPAGKNFARAKRSGALRGLRSIFRSREHHVLYLALIAFCSMGSYYAIYNYISYVFLAAPFHFSRTAIGYLFFIQIFGTAGSLWAGRACSRENYERAVKLSVLFMLGGSVLTVFPALILKIAGIASVTYGLFAVHAAASSWCGRLAPEHKESAAGLYMFAYYCGGSVLGTCAGFLFKEWLWPGVAALSVLEACVCLCALRKMSAGVRDGESFGLVIQNSRQL